MNLARLAAALLALAVLPARAAEPAPAAPAKAKAEAPKAATTATAVIPVKGMTCGGCVNHVNDAVQKVDGVKSVDTDLDKAQTTVVYDPARVRPEQLVDAISSTGYEPGKPKLQK